MVAKGAANSRWGLTHRHPSSKLGAPPHLQERSHEFSTFRPVRGPVPLRPDRRVRPVAAQQPRAVCQVPAQGRAHLHHPRQHPHPGGRRDPARLAQGLPPWRLRCAAAEGARRPRPVPGAARAARRRPDQPQGGVPAAVHPDPHPHRHRARPVHRAPTTRHRAPAVEPRGPDAQGPRRTLRPGPTALRLRPRRRVVDE